MKQRQYIFDYVRVFSCILVIGIHATVSLINYDKESVTYVFGCALQTISRWGLALFYMLSGALLLNSRQNESLVMFYRKRFLKVILPYIVYSLFYIFYVNKSAFYIGGGVFGKAISFLYIVPYYHLWFVYSLISLYIAMPFLRKMVQSLLPTELITLAIIMLVIRGIITYTAYFEVDILITEFIFSGWVIYAILGYIIVQPWMIKKLKIVFCLGVISAVIAFVILLRFSDYLSAYFWDLDPLMILQVTGVFSCFIIYQKRLTSITRLNMIIAKIGRYTFSIYLIHAWILKCCRIWIQKLTIQNEIIIALLSLALCFTISLVIAIVVDELLLKNIQRISYIICKAIKIEILRQ